MNEDDDVVFLQPKTSEARGEVAEACVLRLNLEMPMLLDHMSNEVDTAYSALPDRLFVLGRGGKIAWRSEQGPWGFDADAFEKALGEETGKPR